VGITLLYEDGQTPLDEDEKERLLIKSIQTQGELNEAEQLNIEEALEWTIKRKFDLKTIASEDFVIRLHERMYGAVWKWAGTFRKTNKNIGVDKFQIGTALKQLNDDAQYWISNQTYPPDELAIRYKHRIVNIHCFPNGNGRHSRLMADIIIKNLFEAQPFSWGTHKLMKQGDPRTNYLAAIRAADAGNFEPLLEFARS
jgi:Fic-DOC domain mobile mystery protein B